MGELGAFMRIERRAFDKRPVQDRIDDFDEYQLPAPEEELREQGARCMECGIPFCHSGCPLGNLIPDWNDLVYRDRWKDAIDALHATNNFPEFTGRICPAPCESACVLDINSDAVTIKQIEQSIADRAWDEGWVTAQPPPVRSGQSVAVIGSGPAGLAAAAELNSFGHSVTVYERQDRIGGLLRYGVPDFKLDKRVVQRRVDVMAEEGILFETGVEVGRDIDARELRERFEAVVIATGSTVPRDLPVPGRELDGVHFAMDYLYGRNRSVAERNGAPSHITAAGKHVIVIGGGDTGADCVGNSHREGAASVTQIELLGEPPASRPDDLTPWPRWPMKLRTSYALKEGGTRDFAISTTELSGSDGHVEQIHWVQNSGTPPFDPLPGTEERHPADLVLLAMGFLHPEPALLDALGVEKDPRGNAKAGTYATSADGVFAAGDARRGQSLIVWAINEGRQCARMVDRYLRDLPAVDPRAALSAGASERAGSPELGADPPQRAAAG
jgi:glutamate synthase (NADPH) small chain